MSRFVLMMVTFLTTAIATAHAQTPAAIDEKADAALKRMSDTLANAKAIKFNAHCCAEQVAVGGLKLEFARQVKGVLRRPDRLAATAVGDLENLRFVYDGKRVMLENAITRTYGAVDAPADTDRMMDMLATKYGMAFPLADLLAADAYKAMTENVKTGYYVGEGSVMGEKCDHLAFVQDRVDWQIWISKGDNPTPKKIVITYKTLEAAPRYTALFADWDLSAQSADADFALTPAEGMKQVDFAAPASPDNGAAKKGAAK